MNRHRSALRAVTHGFLAGQESFWDFHERFLDLWGRMPPGILKPQDREAWGKIYAWVLTSIPDPVSVADRARGVMGEGELRERMRSHPLLSDPVSPRGRR